MSLSREAFIGIGIYSPSEASALIDVSAAKIIRWLRGHDKNGRHYAELWHSQIDLGEDGLYLSFRDLMEVRVASAFIEQGLSAQKVRKAISLASEIIGESHPLSTTQFQTDGRTVFLQVIEEDKEPECIDLFKKQYAFKAIIERSLRNIEYSQKGIPIKWWPLGKQASVVIDPEKSFGQPIEKDSSIPTSILAQAAVTEGSIEGAAKAWDVSVQSIKRAVDFQMKMERKLAA